jgi:hypothetical protein
VTYIPWLAASNYISKMDILDTIVKSPIFPFATFVIGLLVRTYFYYKSKKSKVLKYVLRSYNLIKDHTSKFSDLNIKYKNEEVKNFTVTKMIFWNSGKETIEGKDITDLEPLTIKVRTGLKILEVMLLKANNEAAGVSVTSIGDGNVFKLSFDYLDNMDGAVLNIIHNGVKSDDIEISGKIKGLKKIVKTSVPKAPEQVFILIPLPIQKDVSKYPPNKRRFFHGLSFIGSGLFVIILGSIAKYLEHQYPDSRFFNTDGDFDLSIWFYLVPAFMFITSGLYVISKNVPKDLDSYEDV